MILKTSGGSQRFFCFQLNQTNFRATSLSIKDLSSKVWTADDRSSVLSNRSADCFCSDLIFLAFFFIQCS